jgi:hypothetical protein
MPRDADIRWSSNPLSGFALGKLLDELLRELPGRATRAQLLAAVIPLALLMHEWIDDGTFESLQLPEELRGLQ